MLSSNLIYSIFDKLAYRGYYILAYVLEPPNKKCNLRYLDRVDSEEKITTQENTRKRRETRHSDKR